MEQFEIRFKLADALPMVKHSIPKKLLNFSFFYPKL